MKTTNTIMAITIILLAVIACKKAPELEEHKYHELIEGKSVYIYFFHYSGYVEYRNSDYLRLRYFTRVSKNQYTTLDSTTFILRSKIDTIQLYENTDQVTLTKLVDRNFTNDPHYHRYFKNARTISEDSLVGEFYDAFVYSSPNRIWLPTYGEFAMKIKK
jgi:hypothetical protein